MSKFNIFRVLENSLQIIFPLPAPENVLTFQVKFNMNMHNLLGIDVV